MHKFNLRHFACIKYNGWIAEMSIDLRPVRTQIVQEVDCLLLTKNRPSAGLVNAQPARFSLQALANWRFKDKVFRSVIFKTWLIHQESCSLSVGIVDVIVLKSHKQFCVHASAPKSFLDNFRVLSPTSYYQSLVKRYIRSALARF